MSAPALIVIAKAPFPGRSKTRLRPPCSDEQAAALAAAALADTLATVAATPAPRRVLVLDRTTGGTVDVPEGFEVVDQRGDGLDERLAAAFDDVGGPALLVGMDTPQLDPELLASSGRVLTGEGVDAVLGPADDGGYWAVGLRRADPDLFLGVPMSVATTGARQRERLEGHGLRVAELPALRDVDHWADAVHVAGLAPHGRFAATVAGVAQEVAA